MMTSFRLTPGSWAPATRGAGPLPPMDFVIRIRSYPVMGGGAGVKMKQELRDQNVQPPRGDQGGWWRGPGAAVAWWVPSQVSGGRPGDTVGHQDRLKPAGPYRACPSLHLPQEPNGWLLLHFQLPDFPQTPLWANSNLEPIGRRILGKAIPASPN